MTAPSPPLVRLPGVIVDLQGRRVLRDDGSELGLRLQAVEVLCELALHTGKVVDKRHLLDQVWPGMVVTDDSLVQAVGDIRRAIGDDRHVVLQTVPRRGYRLIVPSDEVQAVAALAEATAEALADPPGERFADADATPSRAPSRGRWLSLAGVVAMLLVAAALAAWWGTASRTGPGVAPDRPPIAVLPFTDGGDSPADLLVGRGFSEELALELARNADVPVIATTSVQAANDQGGDLRSIAARLKARYIVGRLAAPRGREPEAARAPG